LISPALPTPFTSLDNNTFMILLELTADNFAVKADNSVSEIGHFCEAHIS